MKLSEKIFGTHSSRELKRIMPLVDKIEELRPTMQAMTDEELKDQTRKFKERLAEGETLEEVYLVGQDPIVRYKGKEVHLNRLKLGKRDGKGSKVRL